MPLEVGGALRLRLEAEGKDSPSTSSGQAGRLQPRDKLGTGGQEAESN
jgi:hypothetical protein